MTRAAAIPRILHLGNDVATSFSFPYKFFAEGDLFVAHRDISGNETYPVLNVDYEVVGGDGDVGSITFPKVGSSYSTLGSGPPAEKLAIILRDDYSNDVAYAGSWKFETVNNDNDKQSGNDQQLKEELNRCLKIPVTDPDNLNLQLLVDVLRAGKFISFDDNGELIMTSNITNEGMGFSIPLVAPGAAIAQGDGVAYFTIPSFMDGMNLSRAQVKAGTAGSGGSTTIDVYNVTQAADMLSTAITLASGAVTGTVGVIDTDNDDVSTDDLIRIDATSVSSTAPIDVVVTLEFLYPVS